MMAGIPTMSLFRSGHRALGGCGPWPVTGAGGPVIEFAMAAPALFLFGIIEFGYALWIQNALDFSAATAGRCASLNGVSCSGQVANYAAAQSDASIASSVFAYTRTAACGCQVTATYSILLASHGRT
jgi:Flp pilus assembly protein TadG